MKLFLFGFLFAAILFGFLIYISMKLQEPIKPAGTVKLIETEDGVYTHIQFDEPEQLLENTTITLRVVTQSDQSL